jgi:hypothetical protein
MLDAASFLERDIGFEPTTFSGRGLQVGDNLEIRSDGGFASVGPG